MSIILKAMVIADMQTDIDSSAVNDILGRFNDGQKVANWATRAAAVVIKSGIVHGSNGSLRPNGNITRAESAVMVKCLLEKAGLI